MMENKKNLFDTVVAIEIIKEEICKNRCDGYDNLSCHICSISDVMKIIENISSTESTDE